MIIATPREYERKKLALKIEKQMPEGTSPSWDVSRCEKNRVSRITQLQIKGYKAEAIEEDLDVYCKQKCINNLSYCSLERAN